MSIGKGYLGSTIGIDIDTCRFGYPNGVAYLYEHLIGYACRYHILCYMAGGIGSTSVHLAGVFPGESAPSVSPLAPIGIYNNFAPCKPCVSVRPSNDENPCWVDMVFDIFIKQMRIFWVLLFNTRNEYMNHILFDFGKHLSFGIKGVMLGGNHNTIYTYRLIIIAILKGYLALGIRT